MHRLLDSVIQSTHSRTPMGSQSGNLTQDMQQNGRLPLPRQRDIASRKAGKYT